jgi:hypothetical protein
MKKNMGKADRIGRILVALIIVFLYAFGSLSGSLAIIAGIIAFVFAATATVGNCPLYSIFSFSTLKK